MSETSALGTGRTGSQDGESAPSFSPKISRKNLIQRKARRERTVFVRMDEDGTFRWEDFSGRLARRGGFGGMSLLPDGQVQHQRGGKPFSESQEHAERAEFTITTKLSVQDFVPLRDLIERVGIPWTQGWNQGDSEELHALVESKYWALANRFMNEPLDPTKA